MKELYNTQIPRSRLRWKENILQYNTWEGKRAELKCMNFALLIVPVLSLNIADNLKKLNSSSESLSESTHMSKNKVGFSF